jgi:hypothetical protein
MTANLTRETDASVQDFLDTVENECRRIDARELLELMQRVTGMQPKMWGPAIIGFGSYHYQYDSGREGDMLRVGFSPRKANLALYLIEKGKDYQDMLAGLGKYRTGGSCLYVNKLADVDMNVLESLVSQSWEAARAKHGDPQ